MKKLLLLLLLSLGLAGFTNASEKENTLARECLEKIKTLDSNRTLLPAKMNKITHDPLRTITGSSERRTDGKENYCNWYGTWSTDAIYGSSQSCAWGSLEVIRIEVNGKNRFDENHEGIFDCAFRGINHELDGIRVVSSGTPLLELLENLRNSNN